MRGQCEYCGAPLRGRASCAYCGTPPSPDPAAVGAPALCVCSVLAQARCEACDTPVCGQHVDSYWRGVAARTPIQDPAEQRVWEWATSEPAEAIWGTARRPQPRACTVCRAVNAEQALSRFRLTGAHATDIDRQIAAYACGVYADLVPPRPTIAAQTQPVLDHLRRRNWPTEPFALAVEWQRKRTGIAYRATETAPAFVVPGIPILGRSPDPTSVVVIDRRCTWLMLGTGAIDTQAVDGGRMAFSPGQVQALAASPAKGGQLTLAGLLGVPETLLDAAAPMPPTFLGFWQKLLVSLSGTGAVEVTPPGGPPRLAAGTMSFGQFRPAYPPGV